MITYNDVVNGVSNEMMEMIHDYIVDRTESYKYGIPAQRKCLYDLVALAEKTPGCYVEHEILKQVQKEINEQRQIEEQELLQKQRIEQEIQRRQIEEFRRTVQDTDGGAQILLFIEKASTYTRTMEIQKLWKSFDWDKSTVATLIEEKINEAAQIERMYGSSPSSITSLLDGLKKLI